MMRLRKAFSRVSNNGSGPLVRYDHFIFRYEPGKEYSLTMLLQDTNFGIDAYTASGLEQLAVACHSDVPPRKSFWAINKLAHEHEVYLGTSRNFLLVHPLGPTIRIKRRSRHKKIRLQGARNARKLRVWASDASEFALACIKIISPSRIVTSYSHCIRAKRVSIQTRPKKGVFT